MRGGCQQGMNSIWYCVNGIPQKEALDKAAYTCLLLSYRRLSAQFQFSLSADTLGYLSQCAWGGVEMYCGPYSAGVLHSVFDQNQNLQNSSPPLTKITSKDDIKGLVSFKFLRPCHYLNPRYQHHSRYLSSLSINIERGKVC